MFYMYVHYSSEVFPSCMILWLGVAKLEGVQ